MEKQTFLLKRTKMFRYHLKLYLRDSHGKTNQRIVTFTTEHLVSEKERMTNARKKSAAYSTSDEAEIDALYRDTGYGIVFHHEDDPKGERKRGSFNITPTDVKKIALKNLFDDAGLNFDGEKDTILLEEELRLYLTAKSGLRLDKGKASSIPHQEVNVELGIQKQVEDAKKIYKEKYGEDIPAQFANDKGFLSALSDPDFDAKAYIEKNSEPEGDDLPDDAAALGEIYFKVLGKNVPNPKKNDVAWIKSKIEEAKVTE